MPANRRPIGAAILPGGGIHATCNLVTTIDQASPLHEVSKVGISDALMLKPGPLSEGEFEIMKTHTTLGATTLEFVHAQYPHNEFIKRGIDIAKYHHEKWDGGGYPFGLAGREIPLSARIMALVDIYEALRARRPYKEPFSHQKAKQIILEGCCNSFDPKVVEAFCSIEEEFAKIYAGATEISAIAPLPF